MEIINLDMTPSTVTPNAHAGQYDASRTVRFMLKNGGVPFTLAGTETITAEITRSDNTEATVNVANTSSNYVDVVFDDTVCTVKGLYACELRLKDSDGFDIGSKNFALLVQRDPYDGKNIRIVTVGPADICTFETTLAEPLHSVLVNVLATGGNGTPDNPNPINGYTEANITRCGVNLWDEEWELGRYNTSTGEKIVDPYYIRAKNYIPVKGGTTCYIVSAYNIRPLFYDYNKNFLEAPVSFHSAPLSVPSGAYYLTFYVSASYGTTYNNDISINYPATDTTYHAYNGQTYAIAFGQTVYGGVLDVTRGKLHVTWGSVDLGSFSYTKTTVSVYTVFWANITGKAQNTNSLCESYKNSNNGRDTLLDNEYGTYNLASLKNTIAIRDDAKASLSEADFKTAMAGVLFAYELATPFDIDLTPEVISAVVGTNNVFADCGETTVKYLKAGA